MDKTKQEVDETPSKRKLTPKLRFPEFKDMPGWEEKKLGEVFYFIRGQGLSKDKIETNGQHECILYGELYTTYSEVIKQIKSKTNIKEGVQSKIGDLLVPCSTTTTGIDLANVTALNKDNVFLGGDITVLRSKEKIDNIFFAYYLSNCKKYELAKYAQGSTIIHLYYNHFKIMKTLLPSFKEQQKIAACLSSLDELIEMQEQKLKALKKHKKGLMQQLFPAEGETTPKLRFPEFQKAGAWEEKEIGQIFNLKRGCVLSMNLIKFEQTRKFTYPVYSSQTKNNGLTGYYQEFLYEDAITWTTDGANAGDVNYREGRFYCTNVCGVLLEKDGYSGYANLFTASILNSVSKNHVSYVGNPKLMNGVMSKIIIPFPSLPEQQKIAACLSSLDELIEMQEQKLKTLKKHKKGLMQQLFPTI